MYVVTLITKWGTKSYGEINTKTYKCLEYIESECHVRVLWNKVNWTLRHTKYLWFLFIIKEYHVPITLSAHFTALLIKSNHGSAFIFTFTNNKKIKYLQTVCLQITVTSFLFDHNFLRLQYLQIKIIFKIFLRWTLKFK